MTTMKKLFALVLALAMMMSVAVFANAYGDSDDIAEDCYDAVELLSAIGLIKGDNHGNFNPENTITRAEAAKIIYVLRNGGVDDNATLWVGSEPFTDVADGAWYAGYVAWCFNYGIINGVSATAFNPNQPIKGTELAKMLLTTAGYKGDIEGYTGSDWEKNVIEDATAAGLFDGYKLGFVKPAARQWAAVMIVNALDADVAMYLGDYRLPMGDETLGGKYLDLADSVEGIVIANDTWSVVNSGSLRAVTGKLMGGTMSRYYYDNERVLAAKGKVLVAPMSAIKEYKAGTLTAEEFYTNWTVEIEAKDDSIVGQEVLLAVKNDGSVLGFSVTGDSVSGTLSITKGTANSKTVYTVKVGTKVYVDAKEGTTALADGIYDAQLSNIWLSNKKNCDSKAVYAAMDEENLIDLEVIGEMMAEDITTVAGYYNELYSLNREASYKAFDFDGDKVIDAVISNSSVYARCSKVSDGKPTFAFGICNSADVWHGNSWTTVQISDNVIGGATLDAFYQLTFDYTTNLRTATKIDSNLGKVTQLEYDANGAISKVYIDGTAYTFMTAGYRQYTIIKDDNLARGNQDESWEALLGKVVTYSVDKKGNLVYAKAYVASSGTTPTTPDYLDTSKIAYLIDVQDVKVATSSTDDWGNVTEGDVIVKKVKVMYADGRTEILTYDVDSKVSGAVKADDLTKGTVYGYEVNADGEIVLTSLPTAKKVVYENKAVTYSLAKNRFGNVLVDDNTVIFVKYTTKVDGKDTEVYATMKISEFKKSIDGASFKLVARDNNTISTALVASIDFGTADLPTDPSAPEADPTAYLIYVTSTAVKYNLGADSKGNPINVAKFTAVDITTGVAGDYYLKDIDGTVTKGKIISGTFNKDGLIEDAYTTISYTTFADDFTASKYLQGAVKAKSGELILIGNTLLDKSFLAKDCKVISKSGNTFTVSSYEAITLAAKTSSTDSTLLKNIVLRTNAEGKIDLIMFTADGKAF